MYELTDAAARDSEQILDRSVVDFGLHQTELYSHSLKNCLALLGRIRIWAAALGNLPIASCLAMHRDGGREH